MGTRLGQDEVICLGLNGETCCARVGYNLEKREHGLFAVHFTADRLIFAKDKKQTKKQNKTKTNNNNSCLAPRSPCGGVRKHQNNPASTEIFEAGHSTEEGDYTGLRTVRVKA